MAFILEVMRSPQPRQWPAGMAMRRSALAISWSTMASVVTWVQGGISLQRRQML